MSNRNIVFIAKRLDGYIANKNGGLDWLHSIPNLDCIDMGLEFKLIDSKVFLDEIVQNHYQQKNKMTRKNEF